MSMLLAARVWHLKLDKTTMLLLMAMCDSANDDGTGCLASEEHLIWKTGVSRAQFYRVRAALETKQIIRRHPLADGRVETLICLDNAPQKPAWKRPKRGGARPHKKAAVSHGETAKTIKGSHGEIKGSHGETSLSHGETDTVRAEPEPVSDGGAFSRPIHPIEPSYYPSSLAQPAQNAASDAPAPPERRTRERFNPSALKRDPLYLAVTQFLPEPESPGEWRQWGLMISRLHRVQASAADIPTAVKGYGLLYPKAPLTLPGIERHWSEIREGKSREQLQLAITRRNKEIRAAASQPDRERQRELARLERERTEREWANELG